jgi:hypothetical protein
MKRAQNYLILALTFLLLSIYGSAQSLWTTTAISTGQTTGHIANLIIDNQTGIDYVFEQTPSIIPSQQISDEELSQPMYAQAIGPVLIPNGRRIEIPVYGYCLDVYKAPTPAGLPMPSISQWIRPGIVVPDPLNNSTLDVQLPGFEASPDSGYLIAVDPTIPLSDGITSHMPVAGPLDLTNRPEEASSYIFAAVPAIEDAFDKLHSNDKIKTPFSSNPEKEREAVIQQTIWLYVSLLEQNEYEKEDFTTQLEEQFEDVRGQEINDEQREFLQQGADQFWTTFSLVGNEAKVFEKVSYTPEFLTDPPERVLPPEEVDKTCEIDVRESIGTLMDGGLSMVNYSTENGKPVPHTETEIWEGLGDGSVVLCADGYDADQLDWYCNPNETCPESHSENTITLTSRVKFRWIILSGKGHFSNNAIKQSGECVILYPSPLAEPSEGSPPSFASIKIKLIIEDAGYGQPIDPKVEKTVTVELKQAHGERAEYKVSGPLYYREKGFKLPVPSPVTGLKKGTCKAKGPEWTLKKQLVDPQVVIPKDSLYPEEKVRLHAKDQVDLDLVKLFCESECKGEEWTKKYPDNVEWKWEILSGGGYLYSKYNASRTQTAYGRTVVFEAPDVEEAPSTTKIRVTVYNPEALQIEDKKETAVIKIPTKCWDRDFKTSHVWLYWEDLIQDRDSPFDEKIAHVSNALHFTLKPESCRPILNDGQEDLSHKIEFEPIKDPLDPDQSRVTDYKCLKPYTEELSSEGDDYYQNIVTLTEMNQCVIVMVSTFYADPDELTLLFLSEEELEEVEQTKIRMYTIANALGFVDAVESGEMLFKYFWYLLVYGLEGLEDNKEFQELKEEIVKKTEMGDDEFEKKLEEFKEFKEKYEEVYGKAEFPGENPVFKNLDMGFLFSYWKICGELKYCQDHCTIEVKSNSRSYLGDVDNKVTRTSTLWVFTPGMFPDVVRNAFNTIHTEQGKDY